MRTEELAQSRDDFEKGREVQRAVGFAWKVFQFYFLKRANRVGFTKYHPLKVLLIVNPKTSCSSIQYNLFVKLFGEEQGREQVMSFIHNAKYLKEISQGQIEKVWRAKPSVVQASDYFKFSFVRNPYARLFSAYRDKLQGGFYRGGIYGRLRIVSRDMSFAQFVDKIITLPDRLLEHHWMPQHYYLYANGTEPLWDFLGRTENPDDYEKMEQRLGLPPTPKINLTKKTDWRSAYDEDIAAKVYRLYASDFALFGYDKESWRSES